MKFSTLTLATVAVGLVSAQRTQMTSKMVENKLNNSANKRALLEKIRRLQDDEDADAEFTITGDYSIRFNSCVAMELETDDEDNNNNYYKNYEGATAVKEVLVVDLVSSDGSVPVQEIAMDIGTFVTNIGTMVYEQVESYCTVCQEIAESCEDGSGTSWLSSSSSSTVSEEGTTVEYVDCETCALYNCNGENDGGRKLNNGAEEGDMESAFTYLTELAECQAFSFSYENSEYAEDNREYEEYQQQQEGQEDGENQVQGQGLYISYMCNEYGTGIDLGFFLDDECTVYTEEESVADYIPENSVAGQYLTMAKSLVEGIFLNSFSCNAIEFASPYAAEDQEDGSSGYNFQYYGNNAEGQDALQASEYCQAVLEGENTVVMGTCSSSTWGNTQTANDSGSYTWYSIEDGDADAQAADEEALCQAIADMQNNYAEAYVNGEEGAEGLFDFTYYGNQNSKQDGEDDQQYGGYDYRSFGKYNEEHRVAANKKSVGSVLFYVFLGVVAVAGVAYFAVYKNKESDEAKKQSLILEGDAGDYKAEGEIA